MLELSRRSGIVRHGLLELAYLLCGLGVEAVFMKLKFKVHRRSAMRKRAEVLSANIA